MFKPIPSRTTSDADLQAGVRPRNLHEVVRKALNGTDDRLGRLTARLDLLGDKDNLNQLDQDFEVALEMFSDIIAEHMGELVRTQELDGGADSFALNIRTYSLFAAIGHRFWTLYSEHADTVIGQVVELYGIDGEREDG